MECIYISELNETNKHYDVPDLEAHHLKVLRLQSDMQILITNGKGLSALATINRLSKNNFSADVIEYYYNQGELDFNIGLAIGILDNKDRFEFAIEKCTELGIKDIFPLITDYSQQNKINTERLNTKLITAIKQCKRSTLPTIHNPISIMKLLQNNNYTRIILADESGTISSTELDEAINSLMFIGAEGGFSEKEIALFPENIIKWNLGNRRLRAETAAILGIGLLSLRK